MSPKAAPDPSWVGPSDGEEVHIYVDGYEPNSAAIAITEGDHPLVVGSQGVFYLRDTGLEVLKEGYYPLGSAGIVLLSGDGTARTGGYQPVAGQHCGDDWSEFIQEVDKSANQREFSSELDEYSEADREAEKTAEVPFEPNKCASTMEEGNG